MSGPVVEDALLPFFRRHARPQRRVHYDELHGNAANLLFECCAFAHGEMSIEMGGENAVKRTVGHRQT